MPLPGIAKMGLLEAAHHDGDAVEAVTVPVLPLTPEKITAIVSMLIKGGYRSADNSLSRAKDEHTRTQPWEPWLEREQKRCAAAARELAPSQSSSNCF